MSVVPFDPMRRFPRPCFVLSSPGKLHSGETWFTIDYLPAEHDGGGQCDVWSGTDYGQALGELLHLQKQGSKVYETAAILAKRGRS